jgi:YD repeat-containing protein
VPSCYLAAENAADTLLKPILRLQDEYKVTPIEVAEFKDLNLQHASFTRYDTSANPVGFAYPSHTRLVNLKAVSASFTPAAVSGNTITMDSRYRYETQYHFAQGNPLQVIDRDGVPVSYVWDYANKEPIAKVSNATSGQIAYTSFEADGTGNWTIGAGSTVTTAAITGRNSYLLNGPTESAPAGAISRSGLSSATTYIVSYWTQGSPFSISGTLAGYPQKGKTISINNTSWTLYVHKVSGQSTITISGPGTIDELRLYPATAQMATYTYDPLVGITSQTDVANRVTYYQYDGLARLKRVRDQDYNILKTFDYQYQATAGCGSGCYIVPMQNFAGTVTLGYPVGVFDVNGKLVGNAGSADDYVTKWNSDTADNRIGTLAKGGDSVHFDLLLNSGQVLPAAVTGCRFYQYDLPWHRLDCVIFYEGDYVDWGDGTGMRIGPLNLDTPAVLPPNTAKLFNPYSATWTFTHTWPNDSLKTLTFYHSDDYKATDIPSFLTIDGHAQLQNLRGNMPQHTTGIGTTDYQQASALSVANIANWNSITSCTSFELNAFDPSVPNLHVSYAQDFMANNRGLNTIITTQSAIGPSYWQAGYRDTTWTISRLKSDWNTYFTELQDIEISDEHWNREDLSQLKKLKKFILVAGNIYHSNDQTVNGATNYVNSIPASVLDSILIQIDRGAGQTVTGGTIYLIAGPGTGPTSASTAAVADLRNKGWYVYANGTN